MSMYAGLNLEGRDAWRIKKCNKCGAPIVLLQSKKATWYVVDFHGVCDVSKNDFHNCERSNLLKDKDSVGWKIRELEDAQRQNEKMASNIFKNARLEGREVTIAERVQLADMDNNRKIFNWNIAELRTEIYNIETALMDIKKF